MWSHSPHHPAEDALNSSVFPAPLSAVELRRGKRLLFYLRVDSFRAKLTRATSAGRKAEVYFSRFRFHITLRGFMEVQLSEET